MMPGYWMNETTGVLRPAVEAYLHHAPMTPEQIAAMRAYLRQWIAADWAPTSDGALAKLRESINTIKTVADIDRWLDAATDFGADPL